LDIEDKIKRFEDSHEKDNDNLHIKFALAYGICGAVYQRKKS
jgi:hypothetical protein